VDGGASRLAGVVSPFYRRVAQNPEGELVDDLAVQSPNRLVESKEEPSWT